ncbi:MAG: TonB-dependent receptor plug domain-containing protein, partial [Flavobacteriales bacterium]|nr:TonB-dependent receptor plug domain-containing protein [Flavobacteriales bacterium]
MKKHLFMSVLGMLISVLSFAQTITVTDEATLQPINGVYIYAKTSTVLTNSKGQADLTSFSKTDSLWFSHVGYKLKSYSYKQLEALQFKVAMSEVAFAIDEVIVSASRFEESSKDVAQPVKVLKAAELQFMNQQTMADVMQSSGQVLVQKSQLGGGSPIIRGFETNKVLMVVDGVRMNNAIYRGGHLQNIITLDNTIMDKVEIVFGPGSVVYGSDALGGVMHFYTRNPLLNDGDGIRTEVQAFTRYSTAYNEKTGHVNFNIAGKRFGSLTSFTYSDFGDLRQGNVRNPFYGDWGKRTFYAARVDGKDSMMVNENHNIQKVSGYKQYDILQKFMFQQNERVSHILNLQFSTSSDVPRYDRLTQVSGGLPRFAEWYYGPQERLFASYTLNLSGQTKLYDNARVIAGFQQIEESRNDRRFNNDKRNSRVENLNIFTFNADFAKKMNKHELRYGVDAWYNDVQSTASSENIVTGEISAIDTRYPDGGSSMQSVSAYLTHSWEISEKLILNDGLRASNISLNAQFNDTTFFPFPFSSVDQNNTALNG